MRKNKKADLSLSINAIVILILAITMLGLGLAFMRNIFGSATKEFQEVGGTVKKQMIDQMKETTKVVDLSNPKVNIKSGEQKQIFIGFKNDASTEKSFQIREIEATRLKDSTNIYSVDLDGKVSVKASTTESSLCGVRKTDGVITQTYLEFKSTTTKVKAGDVVVVPLNIKSFANAVAGTCAFEIKVDTNADASAITVPSDYDKVIELTVDILS